MTKTCIQTQSGRCIDLAKPEPSDIEIEDIAYALSNICRYTGHTKPFYSVGEHCINVSYLVGNDPFACLWGLLHDAHEAYLGDVSKPLKNLLEIRSNYYDVLCHIFDGAILARFKIPIAEYLRVAPIVKNIDTQIRYDERRRIMKLRDNESPGLGIEITPVGDTHTVYQRYMTRFRELTALANIERPGELRE